MATTTPYKREGPFTQRSWKTGWLESLSESLSAAMGTKLSSQPNGDSPVDADMAQRAVKRRRITDESVESTDGASLDHLLPENPADFERVLRIDVLRVVHPDSQDLRLNGIPNGSPAKKDATDCRARCKITIFKWVPQVEMRVLHCDSQVCDIKMVHDTDGISRMARVYLPQPYTIPVEKIYVERTDDTVFGLADSYWIQVELESAGHPSWPPRALLSSIGTRADSESPPRRWVLTSNFKYRFDQPSRMTSTVKLRKQPGMEPSTDLTMDIDLKWSSYDLGSRQDGADRITSPGGRTVHRDGALEPLTNGHVNGRTDHLVNGHRKDDFDMSVDEDGAVDGEMTPSRALRQRQQRNYNLKLLSDKARGKERKRGRRRREEEAFDSGEVVWVLPHAGRVPLDNYQCIQCFATHSRMDQLRAHLPVHYEFKFAFEQNSRGSWRIAISKVGQETPRSIRTAMIEPPTPEDDDSESDRAVSIEPPPRRRGSQRPVPQLQPVPVKPFKPRDLRQKIPQSKQPMFDKLSKSQFEPGSTVDPPAVDDTWLMQKHRDIISDYSDVHPDEKDYIIEWDARIAKERVVSDLHLQEVYLKFIQDKSAWLAASQNRVTEFAKHLNYLKARGAVTEATMITALDIMRQARHDRALAREPAEAVVETSPRAEYRHSKSGCVTCGQPVLGPSLLICSNLACTKPMYHMNCIREGAKMPVENRNWKCNSCHDEAEATARAEAEAQAEAQAKAQVQADAEALAPVAAPATEPTTSTAEAAPVEAAT